MMRGATTWGRPYVGTHKEYKTDKNAILCLCLMFLCPYLHKKPVIFHFNHLLSQKRLADMVIADYNTRFEFYNMKIV